MLTSLDLDKLWVLIAAALVFLMQAGFKVLETGMVRKNHIHTVAMKNMVDWSVVSIVFFIVGFGLMFGHSLGGIIGTDVFSTIDFSAISGENELGVIFFLFQLAFVGTALTIVSGAMSERTGYIPYITAGVVIAGLIYPVFGHWAWGSLFFAGNTGWLEDLGFIDFAGSTVVHSVGAWVSLAGLSLLGPRIGRFDENGKPREFKAYNISYAVLGVLLLWLGWWGFNGGSTLEFSADVGTIIFNTNIAGAAALFAAFIHCRAFQNSAGIYEKLIGGALAGLVAITASPHLQTPLTSLIIGVLAGVVHNIALEFLLKMKIDDAVGAIPVHGVGGALGTLLVVISPEVWMTENGFSFSALLSQLGVQFVGVATCFIWAFSVSYVMFRILKVTVGLRVSPEEERKGITLFPEKKKEEPAEEENQEELEALMQELL